MEDIIRHVTANFPSTAHLGNGKRMNSNKNGLTMYFLGIYFKVKVKIFVEYKIKLILFFLGQEVSHVLFVNIYHYINQNQKMFTLTWKTHMM